MNHRVSNHLGTFDFTSQPEGDKIKIVVTHTPSRDYVAFFDQLAAEIAGGVPAEPTPGMCSAAALGLRQP